MAELIRDDVTGQYSFADPSTAVINQTTGQTAAPVTILSSNAGETVTNNNLNTLNNFENQLQTYQYVDASGQTQQTQASSPEEAIAGAPNIAPTSGVQLLPIGGATSQFMQKQITDTISQGNLTGAEQQGFTDLQKKEAEVADAAARAREAYEAGNFQAFDDYTNFLREQQQAYQQQLSDYFKQVQPLRERQLSLLSPGAKEQELSRQLIDIRSQAEQFALQTEEDKFNEYAGQTLGFAGGRAAEIDRKASFKRQEFALKEKNLLLNLGLEQEARKMEGLSIEAQLGFLKDDLDLQTKIEDRITSMEEDIFNKAQGLRDEARSTLSTILSSLDGIDPESLSTQTLGQLEAMAAQAGLPMDILMEGLDAQYQRSVLEAAKEGKRFDTQKVGSTLYEFEYDESGQVVGQRAIVSEGEGGDDPNKVYSAKDLPGPLRQDVIDTLTDPAGADLPELTLADMIGLFPNIATDTLRELMDEFYDYEALGGGNDTEGGFLERWWEKWF